MIITIIILSILLLLAIFTISAMWYAICKLMDDIFKNDPKAVMKYYFKNESEKSYPCSLLISICEGADFDGSVFDFSEYEETKVIGLTEFRKEITSNGKYEDEDGEPIATILPNQIVYKMKDGSYQWDFTPLM